MMNKKKQGFSLAELLISLLIISIVLSAAIPTITKKSGASRENIWHWSDQNNSIYSVLGDNQSVLMGVDRLITLNKDEVLQDNVLAGEEWNMSAEEKGKIELTISNKGDKLSILKRQAYVDEPDFANSHISFYNTYIDSTSNRPVIKYAGRLTMDPGNIALGIGSLQNQNSDAQTVNGENTAIGHLALTLNETGYRNTALGRKTLTRNIQGHNNTAIGFGSLYTLGSERKFAPESGTLNPDDLPHANTAVGSLASRYLIGGNNNTTIGFASAYTNKNGNANTALGYLALANNNDGNRNTAVGAFSCHSIQSGLYEDGNSFGNDNICLGHYSGSNGYFVDEIPILNYGLYIGTPVFDINTGKPKEDETQPALITGHTQKEYIKSSSDGLQHLVDKELLVNARRVVFSPFDGSANTFEFLSNAGPYSNTYHIGKNIPDTPCIATTYSNCTDGYNPTKNNIPRLGVANFNLRDTGGTVNNLNDASVKLTFETPWANRIAYITAEDKYKSTSGVGTEDPLYAYKDKDDINFNNLLTFDFPRTIKYFGSEIAANKVIIRAENPDPGSTMKSTLVLNDVLEIDPPFYGSNKHDSSVFFNFHKDKMLSIGFKAINPDGTVLESTNSSAPKSTFKFDNADFDIKLTNANQPAPTSGDPPEDEILSVSSQRGLQYVTKKGFFIKSDGGDPYRNRLVFKNIEILDTNTNNDYAFNIKKGKINIHDGDIEIAGIEGFSGSTTGSIKENIKQLWTKVQALQASPSDARLKNITGDNTAGLKEINALEVKNYTYKEDKEKTPHVGVIAQQLQKIFPNSVSKDDKGYLRIRTEEIFYAMVNSIKELCKQIQDLTAKVTGLDKRITELEKQNKQLIEQNKTFEKRLQKLEHQSAAK